MEVHWGLADWEVHSNGRCVTGGAFVLFVLFEIMQSSLVSLVDAFCVVRERDVLRGQYSMAVVGDNC
jgi:hypothetical protein